METDPVAWITLKRGPTGLTPTQFDEWSQQCGYNAWAQKVRNLKLNAENRDLWDQRRGLKDLFMGLVLQS